MRSVKAGLVLALVGNVALGPLHAAGQGRGFLSGDAKAEAKQPFSDYAVRARNVADGNVAATTVLDSQGSFKLDGLPAGTRARWEETLAVWLRTMGDRQETARALHVHPQTVRYRVGQLRTLFGDALDEPRARLRLTLALCWRGLVGPRA